LSTANCRSINKNYYIYDSTKSAHRPRQIEKHKVSSSSPPNRKAQSQLIVPAESKSTKSAHRPRRIEKHNVSSSSPRRIKKHKVSSSSPLNQKPSSCVLCGLCVAGRISASIMMQKNIRLVSFIILGVKGNCISIIHRSVFCRVRMRTKVAYTLSTAAGQLRWPLQTDLSQNIILHTAQFVLYPIPTRTFILRHRAVCVCVCVCVCARVCVCACVFSNYRYFTSS
jgi:hypothetical protein